MERALGDSEREVGALTRIESAVDGAAEEGVELWELVRRREAARRGRFPAVAGVGAFRLIRAASWLRDGMRVPAEGLSDFAEASWLVAAGGGEVDIVAVGGQTQDSLSLQAPSQLGRRLDCITVRLPPGPLLFAAFCSGPPSTQHGHSLHVRARYVKGVYVWVRRVAHVDEPANVA